MLHLYRRAAISQHCRTRTIVPSVYSRLLTLRPKPAVVEDVNFGTGESAVEKNLAPSETIEPAETLAEFSQPELASVPEVSQFPEIGSGQWLHGLASLKVKDVTVVRDAKTAAKVIGILSSLRSRGRVVAWDTETTGVNPKKESPCGHGSVICATAYAGKDVDFGNGPRLFIDCLDGEGGPELLQHFKGFFESPRFIKVWHNYSFDRHVLFNHGIHTRGFGGDTMHMARIANSSRQRYSLEELAKHYLSKKFAKNNMTDRFGKPRVLKNGDHGKEIIVPDTIALQRSLEHRDQWIDYATMDAEITHTLWGKLRELLQGADIDGTNAVPEFMGQYRTLYDVYKGYFVPLGEMLTDMERFGFKVDVHQLKKAELAAEKDRISLEDSFRNWAQKRSPDARYMNVYSDKQKQQLLFAPCKNKKNRRLELEPSKTFVVEQTGIQAERARAEEELKSATDVEEKKKKKKSVSQKIKKNVTLHGLGKTPTEFTASGWPSLAATSLHKLAGRPRADPPLYGDPSDPEMCIALADMIEASSISNLLSTFIVPLQSWPGKDGRIHASLNLNTETGRLSSRRPNLQNQPALEKDRYQVRRAFVCDEGNKLIVADYGQLELRLLAHITKCTSMINAFAAGGDFHSRTAMTMFDYVAEAVEQGKCLLEWQGSSAYENVPLLKDMFGTERRKAKTLNFSIAYGKTIMGLARDWNVSTEEAKATLDLWYRDRPEVRNWQRRCRHSVRERGYVETILGRRRHLPDVYSKDKRLRAHAERAAINAPLQGSAADLVMGAMIELHIHPTLQALGWKVILQVHDEVILEGPEHSAEVALPIVREVMKNPVTFPLSVDLTVDSKIVSCWYDGK